MPKPQSIFYDLETTDLEPIGQILNFSFIVTDENFEILREFSDLIRISRLQLPRAGAIAANKTDVLEHQRKATLTEAVAVKKISDFINDVIKEAAPGSASLIGYNSAKFDLNYLRTTFIRNGINPYFRLKNRDVFLAAKKLSQSNQTFRDRITAFCEARAAKPNLKLETLCLAHSLLDGKQSHESRDDVVLTIALCKTLSTEYGMDVRSYEPYEARPAHQHERGTVILANDNLIDDKKKAPRVLLSAENSSALWIDLNEYRKCKKQEADPRQAVHWYSYEKTPFFTSCTPVEDAELKSLAMQALEELSSTTPDDVFGESDCDIEQFIYRIKPAEINTIAAGIQGKVDTAASSPDIKDILKRHRLANCDDDVFQTKQAQAEFSEYVRYRYGGKAKLNRGGDGCGGATADKDKFHPSLAQLYQEIEGVRANGDEDSQRLMDCLKGFYDSSEIAEAGRLRT